jgi:hypothetical protein
MVLDGPKKMCAVFLVLLSLSFILPIRVHGQENNMRISKFRLFYHSGKMIEGHEGVISGNSFSGVDTRGHDVTVQLENVRSIYERKGSKTLEFALFGGGIMAVGSLIGYVGAQTNDLEGGDDVLPVVAILIGSGVVTGAIIGSFIRPWRRVPFGVQSSSRGSKQETELTLRFSF